MITAQDWTILAGLIDEWWPGEFAATTETAWAVALAGFDAAQVTGALKVLLARGGRFRPSVGEVIAELRRDPSAPTWPEARQLIFGPRGVLAARTGVRKAWWDAGERDRANDEAAWERAGEMHPLIVAFVRAQGLDRLRRLNLDDAEYGQARVEQLRQAFEEFREVAGQRDLAALAASRSERGRLGRFDPLTALGHADRVALDESTAGEGGVR